MTPTKNLSNCGRVTCLADSGGRIDPPLADLRLVDVLDVIVKVADRPIKYTVEDYGVVFSPSEPEARQGAEVVFSFPGGTPRNFIKAVPSVVLFVPRNPDAEHTYLAYPAAPAH